VIRLRAGAAAVVAAAASIAVLVAAEVSVGVAAWAVALVTWSTLAGIRAARWCGFADARPLDRVAVGYALGLFATLAIDQLFVTGLGVAWRWMAPVVLAPLALGEAVVLARSAMGARVSPAVGLVVAGGALLAVGHEWIWSLPLGGAALAAAWLCTERGRGARLTLQLGLLATSTAGAVVALVRRDGRWWLTQNDTHFYEALASSLERWGARDFVLAAGRTLRYHWFPYAWVGAIDRAAGADDYVVLTRVAPVVATVGILLSVVAIAARSVPVDRLGWVVVVFAVSPVFGDWWRGIPLAMAGSFSQLFAMTWLVAVPVALLAWLEVPRWERLAALGLLMLALVGGKANHAVIAAVMLAASWAVLARRGDPRARPLLLGGMLTAGAMAVLGRWLFGAATSLRFLPTDWVPYVQGDLYEWRGTSRALAALVLLAGMVSTPVVAVLAARRPTGTAAVATAVLVAGVGLSAFTNRLYNLQPNGLFAVHSAVSLCWIGVAVFTTRPAGWISMRPWWPATVGLAALVTLPNLDSGATHAVWLRVARSPVALVPAVLVVLVHVLGRRRVRDAGSAALAASVLLALAVQAWITVESAARDYREWRTADPILSPTEATVARWLRDETPAASVVASNHVCATPACAQPEYSADSAFAVAADRRFLVAAPLHGLTYSGEVRGISTARVDRVATSIEFGLRPTGALAKTLRAAGVRWYVAERARSEGVDFSDVGDVRYENADYLVVELRDP